MMSPAAGIVVAGRYALERRFASGAWGSLWHAHDETSQRNCTLRLTGAGVLDLNALRERFVREVRAAHALRCENVVRVLDHGEWSGAPFVVFESLSGEDLATRLRREGRLQPGQVMQVVTHVARALTRAHELGIIHGELRPENIFLSRIGPREVAKVLDFGLTCGGPGASLDTKVGQQLAEPLYASPEQARAGDVDFRSDLWSLAAIAFHCLVGRPPFESEKLPALLTAIASAPVPRLAELDPELPPALDAWCENALSRDPELRFQSAEELAAALAHALESVALAGRPPRTWPAGGAPPSAHDASSAESPSWLPALAGASARATDNLSDAPLSRQRAYWDVVSLPGARQRALRVSLAAVFALLLATFGVALVRSNPTRTPTAEVSLPRRQLPARSIHTPAPGIGAVDRTPPATPAELLNRPEVAAAAERSDAAPASEPAPCQGIVPPVASCGIAPREVLKVSNPPARARRTKSKIGTLLDHKGEPDYGI
jgi:serine/threonine protein kinase